MAQPARPFLSRRRQSAALEAERRELLASLASTRTQIQQAYGGFNTVCDSDLIESYVPGWLSLCWPCPSWLCSTVPLAVFSVWPPARR